VTTLRRRMMEDLQIRNYAPTTVTTYVRGVAEFPKHFGNSPDQLGGGADPRVSTAGKRRSRPKR